MTISYLDDITERVEIQLGSSSTLLTNVGYEAASQEALNELGWSLPITDTYQEVWAVKRAKRHALFILFVESANRFQYKQIKLNHRFDHYERLIKMMDQEFEKEQNDNWTAFTGVAVNHLFGTKIDAGFKYDYLGRDTTYNFNNYVNFTPNED